ncbi:YtxH domain-containing protein [Microcella sp.]|uniref:YtxH domain-containing protein n=1 Tax=Microcella sp. TaxID=1913979 RepID=UPI00391BBAB3
MRGKILFATGLAVGYVLGTRAGRERYEQIKKAADRFWGDPRVQRQVDKVDGYVRDKAPEVAEFVADGAKKVVTTVMNKSESSSSGRSTSTSSGSSTKSSSSSRKTPAKRSTTSKSSGSRSSSS